MTLSQRYIFFVGQLFVTDDIIYFWDKLLLSIILDSQHLRVIKKILLENLCVRRSL